MFPLADFNWRSSASPWRINLDWIGHNVSWKGHPVRPHNLLCMCFCFPYIVTQVSCNNHLRRGEINQGKLLTLCSSGKRGKKKKKKIIYPSDQKQWSALSTLFFQLDPLETASQREVAAGGPLGGPLWKPGAQTHRGGGGGRGERWVLSSLWSSTSLRTSIVEAWWLWFWVWEGKKKEPKVSVSFHSLCTYMGRAHRRPFRCNNWLVSRWKERTFFLLTAGFDCLFFEPFYTLVDYLSPSALFVWLPCWNNSGRAKQTSSKMCTPVVHWSARIL